MSVFLTVMMFGPDYPVRIFCVNYVDYCIILWYDNDKNEKQGRNGCGTEKNS